MVFGMIIMRFNLHIKASKCRRVFIYFIFFVIAVSISTGWCMAVVVHKILTSFMFYEYALIISLINNDSFLLHVYIYIGKASANVVKPLKQTIIFLIL